jgi:calcineurin-like phosphoesterase family protein
MKISLKPSQKLWFTSDTHYSHSNICSATTKWTNAERLTRLFDSLEAMNNKLVENINNCVRENDILIHLGDWSFGGFDKIREFREQLQCKNIHLILGNHDHHIQNNKENIQELFSSVNQYLHLQVSVYPGTTFYTGKYNMVLMHYPIASWNGMNDGVIHLHGHVHLMPEHRLHTGKSMDVGCEGNNHKPISLQEIITIMNKQPIAKLTLPIDQHELRLK